MLTRSIQLRQRGLSLVELMVGIAVGLFIVAAASTLVATQLSDNRRLLLEVQVQQDLRAAADIITRDIRRAGTLPQAAAAAANVASGAEHGTPNAVPTALTVTGATGASTLTYHSSREAGTTEFLGFRLNGNVIESRLATLAVWQALTDDATMQVTSFGVTIENQPDVLVACPSACPPPPVAVADPRTYCWPTLTSRNVRVQITGRSTTDAAVERSVSSVARVRTDMVRYNDPAFPNKACP